MDVGAASRAPDHKEDELRDRAQVFARLPDKHAIARKLGLITYVDQMDF